MKTINEHNDNILKLIQKARSMNTNIECPECKRELMYADNCIYTSNPPKRKIKCECGYVDYILA